MKSIKDFSWLMLFRTLLFVSAILHTQLYLTSTKAHAQDLSGMVTEELKGKTKEGISDGAKNVSDAKDDDNKEFAGELAGEIAGGIIEGAKDDLDMAKDTINFLSEDVYDFVQMLVNNVALIALAVMAGSLIILCHTFKVISVDIFVVAAITWIIAEILFYVAFMLFSVKEVKQFKYDKNKGEDAQIKALKDMTKNANKLAILMTAQVTVYQVLATALAGAAVTATAEAALLYLFKAKAKGFSLKSKLLGAKKSIANKLSSVKGLLASSKGDQSSGIAAKATALKQKAVDLKTEAVDKLKNSIEVDGDTPSFECDAIKLSSLTSSITGSKALGKVKSALGIAQKGEEAAAVAKNTAEEAAKASSGDVAGAAKEAEEIAQDAEDLSAVTGANASSEAAITASVDADAGKLASQKALVMIKNKVLLDCRFTPPIKCAMPSVASEKTSTENTKSMMAVIAPILGIPNAFALDLGSMFGGDGGGSGGFSLDSFTSILGGESGFKLIFYFLDVVIVAVVLVLVVKFRKVIQKFIIHPITRTVLFWVIYGIAQVAVVLMGLVVTRILFRISEYSAMRGILEAKKRKKGKNVENEMKEAKNSGWGGLPSTGDPSDGDEGTNGSSLKRNVTSAKSHVSYSKGLSSSSKQKINEMLGEFSGSNCMKADSKNPVVMAGVDANCECLKTNSCYKVKKATTNNGSISALGGSKVLADAASAIGNKLASGDYKGAYNIAASPIVRKAVKDIKKRAKEVPGRLDQIMKKYPKQASLDIGKAKKEILKTIDDSTEKIRNRNPINQGFSNMAKAGDPGIKEEKPKNSIDDFAKQMGVSENSSQNLANNGQNGMDDFQIDDLDFGGMDLEEATSNLGFGDQGETELLDANLNEGDYRPATVQDNRDVLIFDIIHYRYIQVFTRMNEESRKKEKE